MNPLRAAELLVTGGTIAHLNGKYHRAQHTVRHELSPLGTVYDDLLYVLLVQPKPHPRFEPSSKFGLVSVYLLDSEFLHSDQGVAASFPQDVLTQRPVESVVFLQVFWYLSPDCRPVNLLASFSDVNGKSNLPLSVNLVEDYGGCTFQTLMWGRRIGEVLQRVHSRRKLERTVAYEA